MIGAKYLQVAGIAGLVIALDQYTKHLVDSSVARFETITVIPGFFNLTNVRNPGAAFGILANAPDTWRVAFFAAATVLALVMLAFLIRSASARLQIVSYSLISGGAVGNLIDRIRLGEVIDFIQWHVRSWYWPSFNIADSAITVGVVLLIADMLFFQDKTQATSEAPRGE